MSSARKVPRLLTDDEIRALPRGSVIWCEDLSLGLYGRVLSNIVYPAMVSVPGTQIVDQYSITDITEAMSFKDEYLGRRYWSSEPTFRRRASKPWK